MAFLFSAPFRPSSPSPTVHHPFRPPERCRTAAVSRNEAKTSSEVEPDQARLELGVSRAKKTEKKPLGVREVGGLDVLYDDGFGTASVKDYFAAAKEIVKPDGGPPRWFCPVECGAPLKGAPLLLFLPGIDSTGFGMILHHKSLGKVFEVRCLHIPVNDRTPFEGLVKFIESSVKNEHTFCPNKPIYLVGDSFGGCLALAVAARNPAIDLLVILVNPATSFGKSQLQPFLPILEALPSNLHVTFPYLLSFVMGDPVKMALASVSEDLPPPRVLEDLSDNLTSMLPLLSDFADIIPRENLLWKLKLLRSGAAYVNSRLHAIEAEVLVLASGKDNLLPSGEEADRLKALLKKCKVRYFKDNGHTLLLPSVAMYLVCYNCSKIHLYWPHMRPAYAMAAYWRICGHEGGFNLLTVIKSTTMYRHSCRHDFVEDYLPPTRSEFIKQFDHDNRWLFAATSPVTLSTLENGRIVRGLDGVPDKGPVLLVGYHMLMGLELFPLYKEFLKEKKVVLRGMAHPILFSKKNETSRREVSLYDATTVFGAIPVTPSNLYKLLSRQSFVLLYPGGAREALHRKGEEYKLFWPDQPEFVRMAARFGATIVPFGVVGEDDIAEYILDYNDQMNIPFLRELIEDINQDGDSLRADFSGEVANQEMYLPGLLPKIPGRFYYLFGKPLETQGKDILEDKRKAIYVYQQVKSEVEGILSYLRRKREEDPYRSVILRSLYQASWGSSNEVPTFKP